MTQISGSVTVDIDAGRIGRDIADRVVAAVREELAARFGGPGVLGAADHYTREQEPAGPVVRGTVRHGAVVDSEGHWTPDSGQMHAGLATALFATVLGLLLGFVAGLGVANWQTDPYDQRQYPCAEDELLGYAPEFGPDRVGCIHVDQITPGSQP